MGFYYPKNIDFRKQKIITKIIRIGNKILNIDRVKKHSNIKFKKGPQWFSIKTKYISEILKFDKSIFMHGCCVDELFIQTILGRFENKNDSNKNDTSQAARYIDWQRGHPYVFSINDINELKSKINTQYAFARKINNPNVIDSVFN